MGKQSVYKPNDLKILSSLLMCGLLTTDERALRGRYVHTFVYLAKSLKLD
jgi:hypothetical protein